MKTLIYYMKHAKSKQELKQVNILVLNKRWGKRWKKKISLIQ